MTLEKGDYSVEWIRCTLATKTDKLKINTVKCIGCGSCEKLCPMGNIAVKNGIAVSSDKCTMCYRCISKCPTQAITLLGKKLLNKMM